MMLEDYSIALSSATGRILFWCDMEHLMDATMLL